VNLRQHPQLTEKRLANLTRALVDFQQATQAFILLLPFQKSEDLAIAEAIHPQLPDVSKILLLEDPALLKGVYQGVDMAIGMRLHSLIMAAAEGCRCFALSYDPKVNRLMEDLAMPGWDLASIPEDPHVISKTWLEHYEQGENLSSEQIQSLVNSALMHRDMLTKI
jgi:polysaccharide pyruvyl transferase WcaK-like protein